MPEEWEIIRCFSCTGEREDGCPKDCAWIGIPAEELREYSRKPHDYQR